VIGLMKAKGNFSTNITLAFQFGKQAGLRGFQSPGEPLHFVAVSPRDYFAHRKQGWIGRRIPPATHAGSPTASHRSSTRFAMPSAPPATPLQKSKDSRSHRCTARPTPGVIGTLQHPLLARVGNPRPGNPGISSAIVRPIDLTLTSIGFNRRATSRQETVTQPARVLQRCY